MTILDEEMLVLHDFEHEIPCETPMGCESAAEWLLIRTCCNASMGLCTPHKRMAVLVINVMGPDFLCKICKTEGLTKKDFRFERL